jgi:DNA-binding response OmpR family regulator
MWLLGKGKTNPRLLVVEDSRTQAAQLVGILRSAGFDVHQAADGQDGLNRLLTTAFDLILTDVMMPGLSGYELCHRVKSNPRTRGIPVVLITSLADPQELVHGIQCGADNFLTKPYDEEQLVRRVQAILDAKKVKPSADGKGEFVLMGRRITVSADREQIFNLLFATFEHFLLARQRDEKALNDARQKLRAAETALAQTRGERDQLQARNSKAAVELENLLMRARQAAAFGRWLDEDEAIHASQHLARFVEGLNEELARLQQGLDHLANEVLAADNPLPAGVRSGSGHVPLSKRA